MLCSHSSEHCSKRIRPPHIGHGHLTNQACRINMNNILDESLHHLSPSVILITMTETTYNASCHCGLITLTATLDDALAPRGSGTINSCNCSICTKLGYLLVYPLRSDVVFLNDSETRLKSYYFGQKTKPHKFCEGCGSSVLIDFKDAKHEKEREFLALNVSDMSYLFVVWGGDVFDVGYAD